MVEQGYSGSEFGEVNTRIADLDEKQRIMKNRLLLIGQNLIELKEQLNQEFIDLKKDIEMLKEEMKRNRRVIEMISDEFPKFAKKEDLNILVRQAKMFQPLR